MHYRPNAMPYPMVRSFAFMVLQEGLPFQTGNLEFQRAALNNPVVLSTSKIFRFNRIVMILSERASVVKTLKYVVGLFLTARFILSLQAEDESREMLNHGQSQKT